MIDEEGTQIGVMKTPDALALAQERELDLVDIQLLHAAASAGEIHPKNIHQQRRLDRLDLEGYLEASRHGAAEPSEPPSWVFRLTRKGHRAVERVGP